MSTQVQVDLIADAKEVSREINKTIREISLMGKAIDVNNDIAVRTWKKAAEAAREYTVAAGATHEQTLRLAVATRTTEDRVASLGERYSKAGERGERALSNIMRNGELTGKSVNNLINAAGDLGFAFGPEGAAAAGIMMIGVAIAHHLEGVEEKMEEVVDKFNHHMNEMLENGSAVEAAKQAAHAYVTELEAIAKVKHDSAVLAGKIGMDTDLSPFVRALIGRGDHADAAANAHAEGVSSRLAADAISTIEARDKELEALAKRRKEANDDIAQSKEKLDGMERKGHEREYDAVATRVAHARRDLAAAEKRTLELEALRRQLTESEVSLVSTPAAQAALRIGASKYQNADFDSEHADRDHAIARSGDGGQARGRTADVARNERAQAEKKAGEELIKFREETTEDAVKAMGLADVAEAMAVNAAHDRRLKEIDDMKIDETRKAELRQAAGDLQIAQIAMLNARVQAENEKYAREQKKQDDDVTKKKTKAVQERTRTIEQVEHGMIDALVSGQKDMGRKILRALVEPEVKHLEALSAKHLAMSAAEFAAGNFVGGAKQAVAGALYAGGAATVASIGGGSGGGGGGGGGGGAGSGSAAGLGASLGTSGGADQLIRIEIVNVTRDQNGRETARTRQLIQRLEDQNQPIRVTL